MSLQIEDDHTQNPQISNPISIPSNSQNNSLNNSQNNSPNTTQNQNVEIGIEGDESNSDELSAQEFLYKCISTSCGLGNVWRFPFVCFENGGGAFILPYLGVLFFISLPLYLLELSLGQFCGASGVEIWNISPVLTGMFFAF